MAIIVHSPYDGQPVKVRDQDLGRAIRDGEGRVFYAVKRSDGQGYYGALTRKGSDKDEKRYLEMLEKMETARSVGKVRTEAQLHDATGKKSGPSLLAWLGLLIVAAIIAAVTWYYVRPDKTKIPDEPTQPIDEPSGASLSDVDISTSEEPMVQRVFDTHGSIATPSGLRYRIMKPGKGEPALAGRYVLVHYVGRTLDGREFDRSEPGKPIGFVHWSGIAPRGWDEGISGMCVGERRRVLIPSSMLDGVMPAERDWPSDGPLCFEFELVSILPGVRYTRLTPGEGEIAGPGDTVRVHYRAYLGREQMSYDSTYDRSKPVELTIGSGELIPGWELGVLGMREGEVRTIEIPSYLAYGQRGAAGVIPPGADLRYTVELVRVLEPGMDRRTADAGQGLSIK
ncbi:MAG: hypothetical protein Kow00105_12660 [Phycisphaeraceae bacterium]